MITVKQAEHLIAEHTPSFPVEIVPLTEAHGRILREDILADRDIPPCHRVTMDGIALQWDAAQRGTTTFQIESVTSPGRPRVILRQPETSCVRVMTGATLPDGADCVIPVEELTLNEDTATISPSVRPEHMQFVHLQGADRKSGDRLLHDGLRLTPQRIAIIASAGRAKVRVGVRPAVAIVSTGNELVELETPIEEHHVRPSNIYGIRAALQGDGFDKVSTYILRDDQNEMEARLRTILSDYEVVLLTGGVSMGLYDLIPGILEKLSATCIFHKVRQRPGKPLWFGKGPENNPVFALPGNPVSALVCFTRYVRPQLFRSMGCEDEPAVFAGLGSDIRFDPPLTFFRPVRLSPGGAGFPEALPVPYNGSADFSSLGESDGFVELPDEKTIFTKNLPVRYFSWR